MLGPRDISGEAFAGLLPPRLYALYSAHVDEDDKRRLADAEAIRKPVAPPGERGEPGFFSYDRVRLGRSAADEGQGAWSQDPEDGTWMLKWDLVPVLGGDPDDGEVNYRAQALVEDQLRREHPALGERVEYDTTAEALFVIVPRGRRQGSRPRRRGRPRRRHRARRPRLRGERAQLAP